MSPSFTAENLGIDGSSALLEALIATKQMQWGCEWGRFIHGKQIPVCQSLLFKSGEGDEAASPSFAAENSGIDVSSALLEALIATK